MHRRTETIRERSQAPRGAACAALLLAATLVLGPARAGAEYCEHEGRYHRVLDEDFRTIGFTLCEDHFEEGTSAYDAVVAVIEHLNAIPGSELYFYIEGFAPHTDYDGLRARDGLNRIDMNVCTARDCSYAGRNFQHHKYGVVGPIVEFDTTFLLSAENWDHDEPSAWVLDGHTSLRSNLLHEIGHGLGFDHTAGYFDALSIMGRKNGKWVGDRQVGLKPWDLEHIRLHYDDGTTAGPDLTLSNYNSLPNGAGGYAIELIESDTAAPRGADGDRAAEIYWTRFNLGGTATAVAYTSRVYLSTNQSLDSSDYEVDAWTVPASVPANDEGLYSRTLEIPEDVPGGEYYVILHIDADDDVAEEDEDNNVMPLPSRLSLPVKVTDLAITDVQVAGPYTEHVMEYVEPGGDDPALPGYYSWRSIPFSVQVQNLHSVNASLPVDLTMVYDDLWTDGAVRSQVEVMLPAVAAGDAVEVEFTVDVPVYTSHTQAPTTVSFVVDWNTADWDPEILVDSDPGNNAQTIDLDLDWFRPDYSLRIDQAALLQGFVTRVLLDWTVTNVGPEAAQDATDLGIRYHGLLMASEGLPPLDCQETVSGQVELSFSNVGSKFLGIAVSLTADDADLIDEPDEDNNVASITFTEGMDPDDLMVKDWAPLLPKGAVVSPDLLAVPIEVADLDQVTVGLEDWIRALVLLGSPGPFLPDIRVLDLDADGQIVAAAFQAAAAMTPVFRLTLDSLAQLRMDDRTLIQVD